jgi:glycosyltransferase involved in cell wall biosynthesis
MEVKRVVIIADESAQRGGQAVLALLNARLLLARGVDVVFVCGDSISPELAALDIEVVAAGLLPLLTRSSRQAITQGVYSAASRRVIEKAVARYNSPETIFHLHGWAQVLSPSVFSALAPVADRSIIHAHDMFLACPNGVYMDFRKGEACLLMPLSAACVFRNCDKRNYAHKLWRVARHTMLRRCFDITLNWAGIVAIHPKMVPMLQKFGYPGSLFHVLSNPARPYCVDRVEGEKNESLLYVGRLEPDKGVLDLALAARRVRMPLVCVGSGSLRDRLALDFPDVTATGWLSHEEVGKWAARARAIVIPSKLPEPFGLSLVEAVESGLPAVVSQLAFMADDVVCSGTGLKFDVSDPVSFDCALAKIRDMEPKSIAHMSRLGFNGSLAMGSTADDWIEGLLNIYAQALSKSRRASQERPYP